MTEPALQPPPDPPATPEMQTVFEVRGEASAEVRRADGTLREDGDDQ